MEYRYNENTGDFEIRPAIRPAAQVPPRIIVADSLSRTIDPVRPKPALSEYDCRRIEEYKPVQPQPAAKSSDDIWDTVFCIVISIMMLSILF